MKLKLDLNGDRRLAENVILEVKAAARRLGLEIANVEVVREPPTAPESAQAGSHVESPGRAPEPASRSNPNHCFIPSALSMPRPRSR